MSGKCVENKKAAVAGGTPPQPGYRGETLHLGRLTFSSDRAGRRPFPVPKLWFHATDRFKFRVTASAAAHVAFSNDDAVMNIRDGIP